MTLSNTQANLRAFTASDLSGVIGLIRKLCLPRQNAYAATTAVIGQMLTLLRAENACVYESRGPSPGVMTELFRHDWRDWQTEALSECLNGHRLSTITSHCIQMAWTAPSKDSTKAVPFHCIASCLPAGTSYLLTLAFARRAQPFSDREVLLLRSLHESGALNPVSLNRAPEQKLGLSPRIREVLAGLLSGQSEKQIAAQLQLSKHTVHGYVKSLYRSYNVNTRGELLSLSIDPSAKMAAMS